MESSLFYRRDRKLVAVDLETAENRDGSAASHVIMRGETTSVALQSAAAHQQQRLVIQCSHRDITDTIVNKPLLQC